MLFGSIVIVIAALVCAGLYLCFWRSNSSSDLTGEQNTLPDLTGEQNTLPDLTAEQRIANEPQISFAQRRENAFRKRRKAKASTPAKKNDSPALKTPSAWKQRRDHAFAAFSAKRPSASSSSPWRQPSFPWKQDDRNTDRDLMDGSWVPYTKGPFKNKNIFMFNQNLTMHNSLDCAADTPVHALMVKDPSNWSYSTFEDLKARTRKLRQLAAPCPGPGRTIIVPHEGIRNLFFRHKIGIIFIKSENGNDPKFEAQNPGMIPGHDAPRVEQYFLWNMQTNVSPTGHKGIGYSDALAKRVGKDNFKLLWSNEEMAEFYESCFPQLSLSGKWMKKQIMEGRHLPNAMKLKHFGYLG